MEKALQFFSQNTVNCYSICLNCFFYDFFIIIFVDFIGESIIVFLTKHCQMLQRFSSWVFFLPKLFLLFFFLILIWQRIQLCNFFFLFINRKAKSCGENIVSFLTYKSFCSVSKSLITNTIFFCYEILTSLYL